MSFYPFGGAPWCGERLMPRFKPHKKSSTKVMEKNVKNAVLFVGLLVTVAMPSGLWAQQAGYSQTNLVSNTASVAKQRTLNC